MNPPAPQNLANSTSTPASTNTGNIPVPKRTRLIEVILAPFRKYRLVKSRTGNGCATTQSGPAQRGVTAPPSVFNIIQGISYINRKIITPASVTLAAINDPVDIIIQDLQAVYNKAKEEKWALGRLESIVKSFNEYARIVDVVVGHSPQKTSLIWGGIRFIMQVALNHFEYMEHIEFTLAIVAAKMACCEFYAHIYADVGLETYAQSSGRKRALRQDLDSALGECYKAVNNFVSEAQEYLRLSPVKALQPFVHKMKPTIEELNSKESDLKRFAQMATMLRTKDHAANLQRTVTEIQSAMSALTKLDDILKVAQDGVDLIKSEVIPRLDGISINHMQVTLSFNAGRDSAIPERNSSFVGRKYLLDRLQKEIQAGRRGSATREVHIVLYGTGGMGKTQLALEYVYSHSQDYSAVFWVNATSIETTTLGFVSIMQSLIDYHSKIASRLDYPRIAQILGMTGKVDERGRIISGEDKERDQIVDAVKDYFTTTGNSNWLLVLDNADDDSFIDQYIPSCNGAVILTSRRREMISRRRGFEIQQMEHSEAEMLLYTTANRRLSDLNLEPAELEDEQQAVKALLETFGYLPLAIDQAGGYIHATQHTYRGYWNKYEGNVRFYLGPKGNVNKNEKCVLVTWELSFESIRGKNPEAAELLLLCGFLGNDDICEDLLRKGKQLSENDELLEEFMKLLLSYSLARRKNADSLTFHPLVHQWTRRRLETHPEQLAEKTKEALLLVMSAITLAPQVDRGIKDWIFERRIMPHVAALEGHIKDRDILNENIEILDAAAQLAKIYSDHNHYDLSMNWHNRVLAGREKRLGPEDPATLSTVHSIASVFTKKAQYNIAMVWYERALKLREKVLGDAHIDTLQTVHDMALVLKEQGQYKLALGWYQRALSGREKALGVHHADTLNTINNMALVHHLLGNFKIAVEWYERALAGREDILGKEHPETLGTVHNMALNFSHHGQHEKALEWYNRALAGKEKSLGPNHPSVLMTVRNIAQVFNSKAEYDKALEWFQRALDGMESSLGKDHPETLSIIHDMGSLFENQGQYNRAMEYYQRALSGREQHTNIGPEHPDTLATVNNMANLLTDQGQYDKALGYHKRALAGKEKSLGLDHPDTLITVHNIASVYESQGRYDEGLEWFQKALDGQKSSLGADHPHTLTTMRGIAGIFYAQGQNEVALEWYKQALAGFEKLLGREHPQTLSVIHNIASTYDMGSQYDMASKWYDEALAGQEKLLGSDHPATVMTVFNIATLLYKQGQYEKSLEGYQRVFNAQKHSLGPEDPETLETAHCVAVVASSKGDDDIAALWFKRALEGRQARLGDSDPSTQDTLRQFITLLRKTGNAREAETLESRLLSLPGADGDVKLDPTQSSTVLPA